MPRNERVGSLQELRTTSGYEVFAAAFIVYREEVKSTKCMCLDCFYKPNEDLISFHVLDRASLGLCAINSSVT